MKHCYKTGLLLFIILLSISQTTAQNLFTYGHADNEVLNFGHRHLISFQSDTPQVNHKSLKTKLLGENTAFAVYSDKQGKLKLYSNGCHIWNGNHQPLNTTSNVLPDSVCQRFTVNDSLGFHQTINTAIPMPGNPDLIYVFSIEYYPYHNLGKPIMYYSLVDLFTGQIVISGKKFSDMPVKGYLTATKHTNGQDYWLVTRKYRENSYVAFRIRPGGNIDTVHSPNTGMIPSTWGYDDQLKLSPDGRILGERINLDTLQLLQFNAQTGIVSDTNIRYIIDYGYQLWPLGFAFSPDNSKFYVIHQDLNDRYCQYDLATNSQSQLLSSRKLIFHGQLGNTYQGHVNLFLTANHNIYNPYHNISGDILFNSIEEPNLADTNCNWNTGSFVVDSTDYNHSTRSPIFCSSWLQEPVDISYTHTCVGGDVGGVTHFSFTDSVYKATWHFGDTVTAGPDTSSQLYASHQYQAPGKYTVWAKALHYGMWDSVAKTITIHQNPQISLGQDTTLTGNDTLVLDPGSGYVNYKWNTGDTTQTLTLYGSQMSGGSHTYWVEVTDSNGCEAKAQRTVTYSGVGINEHNTDKWKVYPNPAENKLTIELDQALQDKATLRLYDQHGAIVRRYEWPQQDKTMQLSLEGLSKGIYWLELSGERRKYRQKVMKR